ncbi:signal peptide peptidase SppA [Nitrosophilus kaiyonis]|uniref:signal peptide peptidase SppA n=1 Tax=Nitrosophilus kaiyonis TaxID=2930200 RepID=UPI00248F66A2|nr:signal peptide peptidase SppA [Nitrosophilus kaiyonis]
MSDFFKKIFKPITALLEFIQKYFKSLIFLLIVFLIFSSSKQQALQKPNLMEIELKGPIIDAKEILKKIDEANRPNIKGVLFVVSSPGGAVAPSIEISLAIKKLKEKKPVIAYAAGTMASGSYYASIWANKIIANPGSAIGSIGVIFESANIKKLIDKIGIEPQVVKAGKYKEVGTPFREWKSYEKEEIKKVIFDTYDMFVKDVAKARGLKIEDKDKFAEAHIFTARQAKKVGLIDKVGTIYDAKKELIKLSGVKRAIWKKEDKFEKFMEKIVDETSTKITSLLFGFTIK